MDFSTRSRERTSEDWKTKFLLEARNLAQFLASGSLDEHDAEDVAQDVVLYFLTKVRIGRMLQPPSHWQPMIRRMVKHRIIDLRRRQSHHRRSVDELTEVLQSVCSEWMNPGIVCEAKELDRIRRRTMRRLPRECRDVFVMVRQDDASYKVAAGHFGITPLAVCAHVVRAQRLFRAELAASGFAAPPKREVRRRRGGMR